MYEKNRKVVELRSNTGILKEKVEGREMGYGKRMGKREMGGREQGGGLEKLIETRRRCGGIEYWSGGYRHMTRAPSGKILGVKKIWGVK